MQEFRRYVSYLYLYRDGRKENNVGFARVELREQTGKIWLRFRIPAVSPGERLDIYLFSREGQEVLGVLLGSVVLAQSHCEIRKLFERSVFDGHGTEMEQMCGVFLRLPGDPARVIASCWDDGELLVERFRERGSSEPEPAMEQEAEPAVEQEAEPAVEQEAEAFAGGGTAPEEIQAQEIPSQERAAEQTPPLQAVSEGVKEALNPEKRSSWERISRSLTKIYIPEWKNRVECVKMKPHHFCMLPQAYRNMCNNHFLLHGFYAYQYLILGRISEEEGGVRYMIGIPGVHDRQEEQLARFYGFPGFLQSGEHGEDFGYWYREIILDGEDAAAAED